MNPLLVARDVRRSFGSTVALDGTSVAIDAGQIVAIMGPSGSGKSTLLHCLAGILVPERGEIHYEGQRLDLLPESERSRLRRTDFGFVFQFGQLVPELSALENVSLPLRLGGMRRRDAERRASEWLDRLEVAAVAAKQPGELSGGEGQRVAVARALVGGPRVVFADEPTGALDSLNGERVMTLLVDAARAQATSIVLVTHEARVAAYADSEIFLRDGRVIAPVGAA